MRITKWIFFAYVMLVALIVAGIAVSFAMTPPRDPHTLHTTYGANIKSLDPSEINDTLGSAIAGQMYECLYNYQYNVRPYALMPELAAALPQISADGKTVTIPIRKGIHFYDPDKIVFADGIGPEVKAKDFVYSFKRICNFQLASPQYSAIFEGKFDGLEEWWNYTKTTPAGQIDWDRPVKAFEAVDDYTLRLNLSSPYPQLRYNLAHLPTAVVCRAAVEKYGPRQFRKHPIGTGPYCLKFSDHLPEQRIVLNVNPIYRGRPDADVTTVIAQSDRLPHIKRLQYDFFREPVPVWLLFLQGYFDLAGIPKDSYRQAISATGNLTPEMESKGIVLRKNVEPATYYVGFNMHDPILGNNRPLRQAMSMAVDRQKFIENFLNGRGQPAIGPIPPGFPTFDPSRTNPFTRHDPDSARKLIAEAEKINGGPIPPITLLLGDTDTEARQQADFFVSEMAQINITINPEYLTWARFQERVDSGQCQLFSLGWVADYPDEQTFLQLFYGRNATPGGINPCGYVNPQFDKLYEQAMVMNPSPQRDQLYIQMQQIVMEDCPWISQFYPVVFSLSYNWIGNYGDMDYGYGMRQYLTLDESARTKALTKH